MNSLSLFLFIVMTALALAAVDTRRVRKEIRDLSKLEWDRVVAGVWAMKNTRDEEGVALYGPHFVSYDAMVARHALAALNANGDQGHFSVVFPLFHRLWLLQFEESLISTDALIDALPYWDFARDDPALQGIYPSLFSDEYLGEIANPPTNQVTTGRFANWTIMRQPQLEDLPAIASYNVSSVYGYLRHPLSLNRSPILTRGAATLCGVNFGFGDVNAWDECINGPSTIEEWLQCVDPTMHGPAHLTVGGTWRRDSQTSDAPDCAQWFGVIRPQQDTITPPPQGLDLGLFINPYILGCFACPTCSLDMNPDECVCTVIDPNCGPLWTGMKQQQGQPPLSQIAAPVIGIPLPLCEPLLSNSSISSDSYSYSYSYSDGDDNNSSNSNSNNSNNNSNNSSNSNSNSSTGEEQRAMMNSGNSSSTIEFVDLTVTLQNGSSIQITGDFADSVASPNDPLFAFHHANLDRHFQTWITKMQVAAGTSDVEKLDYFSYPRSGQGAGGNLDDIVSGSGALGGAPFFSLFGEPVFVAVNGTMVLLSSFDEATSTTTATALSFSSLPLGAYSLLAFNNDSASFSLPPSMFASPNDTSSSTSNSNTTSSSSSSSTTATTANSPFEPHYYTVRDVFDNTAAVGSGLYVYDTVLAIEADFVPIEGGVGGGAGGAGGGGGGAGVVNTAPVCEKPKGTFFVSPLGVFVAVMIGLVLAALLVVRCSFHQTREIAKKSFYAVPFANTF